jgi:hypothetical protein
MSERAVIFTKPHGVTNHETFFFFTSRREHLMPYGLFLLYSGIESRIPYNFKITVYFPFFVSVTTNETGESQILLQKLRTLLF